MVDWKKIVSKSDRIELEKLDKWGDFLNGLADISDIGASLLELALIVVLMYTMRFEKTHLVDKIITGTLIFYFPWIPWAIKCMGIPVNFTVSKVLLISSGIVVGARAVAEIIDHLIDKANNKIKRILDKYRKKETDYVGSDTEKRK